MAHLTRLILAPLRGLTDAVFRSVYAAHFQGLDEAVAPFVVATGAGPSDKLLADLQPERNRALPVVPQILGNDARSFVAMSARLAQMGHERINWNLGCPFPMVTRKMRGSGLLDHPERIAAFLDEVIPSLPLKLSIKMRLGRRGSGEIRVLLPVLDRYPLEALIIHPRTAAQMYAGCVDLEAFAGCLKATRHPVVYNGDICTVEDLAHRAQRFPQVAAYMLGRGVLADPFLPSRIRALPLPADRAARLGGFHEALLAAYRQRLSGPGHLVDRMKGFWRYLARAYVDAEAVWGRIRRARDLSAYRGAVEAVLGRERLRD
jgi:tRNA-dihydrouridine synthase